MQIQTVLCEPWQKTCTPMKADKSKTLFRSHSTRPGILQSNNSSRFYETRLQKSNLNVLN